MRNLRIAGYSADIRTYFLSNTNTEGYHYIILLSISNVKLKLIRPPGFVLEDENP
jgi:hypothetical protein